ncbi:MAG: trypsin-like serine protease [Deltaproteobacteria bacterium]|nr:trypsin-like serine protease [Deltaproteobacteria bacterium]
MRRQLLIVVLLSTACGGDLSEELGSHGAFITDGVVDTGHPSVGLLDLVLPMPDNPTQLGSGLCTGTLVGQRTVLTAAHCLEDIHQASFKIGGKSYAAKSWKFHPQYDTLWLETKYVVSFDIGVVLLDEAPPITSKSVGKTAPTVGAQITLVGFGDTAWMAEDYGTKRQATNNVAKVTPHELNVIGTGNGVGNICHGDSGGPAFIQRNGVEVLVGINSRGSVDYQDVCGASEFESRVDVALGWLREVTAGDIVVEGEQPTPSPAPTTEAPQEEPPAAAPPSTNTSYGTPSSEQPATSHATPAMIRGSCSVGAGAGSFGLPLLLLALLIFSRRRAHA